MEKNIKDPDEKVLVYTIECQDRTLYDTDIESIIQTFRNEVECIEENELIDFQVGRIYMTQAELNLLPEFEGFD